MFHVSILKWNDIFDDETHLLIPLRDEGDTEEEIQLVSTYAMRSGLTNKNISVIEPHGNFSRHCDLRDFLHSISKGANAPYKDVVHISLPSVILSIAHQGNYNVPPEDAADRSKQELRLGNFSAADLRNIALDIPPLRLAYRAIQ